MSNPNHPVWFILFCLLILIPIGLTYSRYMYANGVDLAKDTGLVGLVGLMTAGYHKIVNS